MYKDQCVCQTGHEDPSSADDAIVEDNEMTGSFQTVVIVFNSIAKYD